MLYDGPYPTSFYHVLHSRLHAEFRLQKAQGGRAFLSTLASLLCRGQAKGTATLCRDAALLPLLELRLEVERRRAPHDASSLPTELSRDEAATPSAQDEPLLSVAKERRA
jgi:hypothetical protein